MLKYILPAIKSAINESVSGSLSSLVQKPTAVFPSKPWVIVRTTGPLVPSGPRWKWAALMGSFKLSTVSLKATPPSVSINEAVPLPLLVTEWVSCSGVNSAVKPVPELTLS